MHDVELCQRATADRISMCVCVWVTQSKLVLVGVGMHRWVFVIVVQKVLSVLSEVAPRLGTHKATRLFCICSQEQFGRFRYSMI